MSLFVPNSVTSFLSTSYTGGATTDLTIMCWGFLAGARVAYRNFLAVEPNIAMQTFSDGVTFDVGSNANDHTGSALSLNTWYHLCQTVRNTSTTNHFFRGYVNGVQNVDVNFTETFVTYTTITVGNSQQFGLPLLGNVRDVRIWTRAMSPSEVVREMQSPRPSQAGLLLWSPLDDDQFTDRSGNGHLWTSNGAGLLTQGAGSFVSYPRRSIARVF